MAQLTNTIFKFPTVQKGSFIVQDYSRNKLKSILDLPEITDNNFIMYIDLEENQTIEAVSYILYNNENYWDILIAINNIDPLFGLCYDFDTLNSFANSKTENYRTKFGITLSLESYNRLLSQWKEEIEDENAIKRKLKVIRPNMINEFIRILRNNGFAKNTI